MSTRRFYKNTGPYSLSKIIEATQCSAESEHGSKRLDDIMIHDIRSLLDAGINDLTFLDNQRYLGQFYRSKAAACIVPLDFAAQSIANKDLTLLRAVNPYKTYADAMNMFYSDNQLSRQDLISSTAYISSTAILGKNCRIGHNVVIEDYVEIGDNAIIESGTVIAYNVLIGRNARIKSNVTISHSIIGDNVVILPGARIGQNGFGFATDNGRHIKIYHTGRVRIGNDVEIGANSCVDRGSNKDTIIEDMCRIDNLVQIAHNVHIKKGSILAAQVGISGSSMIGSYCAFGGQVGIAGHLNIANGVQLAGQSGVIQDIKKTSIVMGGTPAVPIRDWHRQTISLKMLINRKI